MMPGAVAGVVLSQTAAVAAGVRLPPDTFKPQTMSGCLSAFRSATAITPAPMCGGGGGMSVMGAPKVPSPFPRSMPVPPATSRIPSPFMSISAESETEVDGYGDKAVNVPSPFPRNTCTGLSATRSGLPSPFTSPTATRPAPVINMGAANVPSPFPSRIAIFAPLPDPPETATSMCPSPLKSAVARYSPPLPAKELRGAEKVPSPFPNSTSSEPVV